MNLSDCLLKGYAALHVFFLSGFSVCRVHTGPGKPGKSWNFMVAFSRTRKSFFPFPFFLSGFSVCRVHTGPGKPGKSWNFIVAFPGLESPGKRLLLLESSGNLLNSSKNMKCMADSK